MDKKKTYYTICWIVVYQVDSIIHHCLKNLALVVYKTTFQSPEKFGSNTAEQFWVRVNVIDANALTQLERLPY